MQLEISDEARFDLAKLYDYGAERFGRSAAASYILELLEAMDRIVDWPLSAELRDELTPPMRLLIHGAHNIFYEVGADEITIVRVLHYAVDWKNLL